LFSSATVSLLSIIVASVITSASFSIGLFSVSFEFSKDLDSIVASVFSKISFSNIAFEFSEVLASNISFAFSEVFASNTTSEFSVSIY